VSTSAQIAANQHNAQLSTGPTSETGKTTSSRNALKTGLTGRTVLLPAEDAALYEAHLNQFVKRFSPVGDDERNLVQSLADTEWRLMRIPSLEMGIYAVGRVELAELFPHEEPAIRQHMIEAKVLLTYKRDLSNLSIQETRLRRHREKDLAALKELQDERKKKVNDRLKSAASLYIDAVHNDKHSQFDLAQFGFEFSLAEIEVCAWNSAPISSTNTSAILHRAAKLQERPNRLSGGFEMSTENPGGEGASCARDLPLWLIHR